MTQEWKELAALVRDMQRRLAEVTKERDHYKAACELADALRNRDRQRDFDYTVAGRKVVYSFEGGPHGR